MLKMFEVTKIKNVDDALTIAKELPDFFTETALKDIEKSLNEDIAFGFYKDTALIGFLTAREANGSVVELTWMGVKPEFQNQGVGTELLNRSLDILRKKYRIAYGKTLADTTEDEGYSNTRSFWFKNGFYPLETVDPYPGWDVGNPCLIFVKPL